MFRPPLFAALFGSLLIGPTEPVSASRIATETPLVSQLGNTRRPTRGVIDVAPENPVEEEAEPLVPLTPRSEEAQSRVDALTWFMTGRYREARRDFQGALDAYKESIEHDPQALEVYHAIVSLAFGANQTEEAIEYAKKAVELFPDDFALLHRLGVFMVQQGDLKEAIKLLKQASNSPKINKQSGMYVALMVDLGELYRVSGDIDEAANCYEVVFSALTDPDSYNLDFRSTTALRRNRRTQYERIGETFLEANRPQLAIRAFREAAKSRRGRPGRLNYYLARVYLQTEELEKALDELQIYFDAQLQEKESYVLLADVLKAMEREEELIPRLEELSEKDPYNSTLQFFLAEKYVDKGRLDDAEDLYLVALKRLQDVQGYVGLARVYRQQHRAAEMLQTLEQAFEKAIGQDAATLQQLQAEADAIAQDDELIQELVQVGLKRLESDEPPLGFAGSYLLAKLAIEADEVDAAMAFFDKAISTGRRQENVLVGVYDEYGRTMMQERRFADAVRVYQQAIDDNSIASRKQYFLYFLASAQEYNGETESALATNEEARRLSPNASDFHLQEAWIFLHSQQWDNAIDRFEKVIARFADDKDLVRRCRTSISSIHMERGDNSEAEKILEELLAEDPDDPSVNNDLGYLYADQGKYLQRAEKMIRIAIEAEPENAAYLDSMGWVLYRLEKYAEGVTHLEKAAAMPDGKDSTILDHLGDCYHKLGKSAKAATAWEEALKLAREEAKPDQNMIDKIKSKIAKQAPEDAESSTEDKD